MANDLDAVDDKLMALLRADARTSLVTLAKKLGLARATVANRIARLERDGVIAGYTVRLGAETARRQVAAIVMININAKLADRVVHALRNITEVVSLKAISGIHDLVAELSANSTEDIDRLLDEIGKLPGIERTMSSIVLSTKFSR